MKRMKPEDCTLETAIQILRMIAENTIMEPQTRILYPRLGKLHEYALSGFLRACGEAELIEKKDASGQVWQQLVKLKPETT